MKIPIFLLPIVCSLSALFGCTSEPKSVTAEDTRDYCAAPITATDDDGSLLVIAQDKYNYSFRSSVEIQSVPVQSLTDIRFDWSAITKDMLGRPFDPLASVDMMELTLWTPASSSRSDGCRPIRR